MAIIWDNAWNIGHVEIDEQHRKWVDLFNNLESAFLSSTLPDLNKVQKATLTAVIDYTSYHFANEEKLMSESSYPEAASHWRLHKAFKNDIYEKFESVRDGRLLLTSEILSVMRNWLLNHIQVEDRKFGLYQASR